MRKLTITICLTLACELIAIQPQASADRVGARRGSSGSTINNAVEGFGDDGGGNSGIPRVQDFHGTVRKTPRATAPAPEQSGMPVYVSPCQTQAVGNANPKVITAAFTRIANVTPEPNAPPATNSLEFDPANPPTTYFAVCRFAQPATGTPGPDDQADVIAWVKDYFSQTPMPVPQPEISAPNGGICGVMHTVDLHIDTEMIHEENATPFGDLSFHVYGRVLVNWGDGSKNVYTTGGAAYPNSDIKHTWTTKGTYKITSHVDWIANFTIGPYNGVEYSGVIAGISTDGAINNFRMFDAQAMITE